MKPTQCHLWNETMLSEADLIHAFQTITTYSEDPHASQRLVQCVQCNQLYLKDFYEEVDWVDSEDSMRTTFVPVEDTKQAEELIRHSSVAGASPSLHEDFLKGEEKRVYWVGKD